jgi:hypothetical protein
MQYQDLRVVARMALSLKILLSFELLKTIGTIFLENLHFYKNFKILDSRNVNLVKLLIGCIQ